MNTFNFTQAQAALSKQSNEFAKVFTAHTAKIAAAQQNWLQSQADTVKTQFENLTTNKDLAANAQSIQNNVQPVAESMIKHAQQLFNLTLAAQKELTAKVQESYQAFATEANSAVDTSIKKMSNEGEPFVGMAKNASQSIVSVFEQVANHVKTAQANYETQVTKLFDNALTAITTPVANVAAKATATVKKIA